MGMRAIDVGCEGRRRSRLLGHRWARKCAARAWVCAARAGLGVRIRTRSACYGERASGEPSMAPSQQRMGTAVHRHYALGRTFTVLQSNAKGGIRTCTRLPVRVHVNMDMAWKRAMRKT